MENAIFKTRQLCFNNAIHYGDLQILKDKVNFIVGKSGTGKSTLLRLFNGTLTQSSGDIFYQEEEILSADTIALRKEVALISQAVYLFDKSIKENFIQFYEYRGLPAPSDDRITDFLNLCCVSFPLDKDCTTMSGGERQRVYIAIYLSFQPKVIMLDEPTSALDKENSHDVMKNILAFCKEKGITVIIVSHDNELTKAFAENIIVIEKEGE